MQSIPVNQGGLAAWLGVSSSQLSMNSSGRHGPRKLKDAAAEKWATLALTYRQAGSSGKSCSCFVLLPNWCWRLWLAASPQRH